MYYIYIYICIFIYIYIYICFYIYIFFFDIDIIYIILFLYIYQFIYWGLCYIEQAGGCADPRVFLWMVGGRPDKCAICDVVPIRRTRVKSPIAAAVTTPTTPTSSQRRHPTDAAAAAACHGVTKHWLSCSIQSTVAFPVLWVSSNMFRLLRVELQNGGWDTAVRRGMWR